jgi:hypothetical protein
MKLRRRSLSHNVTSHVRVKTIKVRRFFFQPVIPFNLLIFHCFTLIHQTWLSRRQEIGCAPSPKTSLDVSLPLTR